MYRWIVVSLVAALALTAAGCGKKAERNSTDAGQRAADKIVSKALTVASGKETKVDVSGETITIAHGDGTTVVQGKGAGLPEGFPSDVPVYKGGEIMHSASMPGEGFSVSMQTGDARAEVAEYYKKAMPGNGWESHSTMDMPNATMLTYKKGDIALTLMVAETDEGTVVNISGVHDK